MQIHQQHSLFTYFQNSSNSVGWGKILHISALKFLDEFSENVKIRTGIHEKHIVTCNIMRIWKFNLFEFKNKSITNVSYVIQLCLVTVENNNIVVARICHRQVILCKNKLDLKRTIIMVSS